MKDRWQRIEEVFHRAIDLPEPSRPAFLASACAGDDDLRREVESLLANDHPEEHDLEAAVSAAVEQLPEPSVSAGTDLIGKQIGGYSVTELIGKGGMGMVFKALDTQLRRSVAIKILPPQDASDLERRRRLLREAKAASALNHPNIVAIYSVAQDRGIDFLVMEFVAGKTLDQLIPRKGLPFKQALKYAIEVADAIAAAHAAGIVHRDIKPSNIMITEQGRAKVLDFGLAKLVEPAEPGENVAAEPLETKAGRVFGTAGYMSPEQAEGKRADARSDIFAFGALLYEMVTGQRAFQGKNVITILAAVISEDPVPAQAIAPNVPPELEWVITRCLKKDPERRIQHMQDVKVELQAVLDGIESALPAKRVNKAPRGIWVTPVVIALLLGLVPGVWMGRHLFRKESVTFQRLTFRRGDVLAARFAPGGNVVYAAAWDGAPLTLFSAQPGKPEARDLGLPSGNLLSVSHSGDLAILIGSGSDYTRGTLAQAPLAGGAPREILEDVYAGDWSPDGKSLAVTRADGNRYRLEYPIGAVLYQTEALRPPLYVRVSPKGDFVSFFDFTDAGDYSVMAVNSKGQARVLSKGWRAVAGLAWSPDSNEVWFSGSRASANPPALYAVDLSGRERLLTQLPGSGVLLDVAGDGRILLANVDSRIGTRCMAPQQAEERDLGWLDASFGSGISDDGSAIILAELSDREGRNDAVYLRRTDGSPAVRLGYCNRPALSPDGKLVVCVDANKSELVLLLTGPGEPKTLPNYGVRPETADWFPDGKRILFTGSEVNSPPRTYVQDVMEGQPKEVTPAGLRASAVSPNGQFATVLAGGRLFRYALETGRQTAVSAAAPTDSVIRWSADGRYIFLQHAGAGNRTVQVLRIDAQTGDRELWRELKPPETGADIFGLVKLTPDGRSYTFAYQRDLSTLFLAKGIQ